MRFGHLFTRWYPARRPGQTRRCGGAFSPSGDPSLLGPISPTSLKRRTRFVCQYTSRQHASQRREWTYQVESRAESRRLRTCEFKLPFVPHQLTKSTQIPTFFHPETEDLGTFVAILHSQVDGSIVLQICLRLRNMSSGSLKQASTP